MIGPIFRAIGHGSKHLSKHGHRVAPHAARVAHKTAPHVVKHVSKAAPTVHHARVPAWIEKGRVFHRHVSSWLYGK